MWLTALVPAVLLLFVYRGLPEQVPIHFRIDGTADAYGARSTMWLLAGIGPLLALLLQFLPAIDPKKRNYIKFQKYYDQFAIALELFLLVMFGLTLSESFRPGTVSFGRTVTAALGILFLLLGNMMGKIKHNYFFGIRTPWTLADPDIWTRTHSLGGKLWFALGLVLLPCSFLLPERALFVLLMAGALGSMAALFLLSYLWYRRRQREAE